MVSIESIPTPTYATIAQIRDILTDISTDEEANVLLIRAEQVIDLLVGFHKKYYWQFPENSAEWQDQKTIFPRDIDVKLENDIETPFIPYEIHKGALLIAEALYVLDKEENEAKELNDLLLGADSTKIGDFAISKKATKEDETLSLHAQLRVKLSKTSQGKTALTYIDKYRKFSFTAS